jgi:hypothetical protein
MAAGSIRSPPGVPEPKVTGWLSDRPYAHISKLGVQRLRNARWTLFGVMLGALACSPKQFTRPLGFVGGVLLVVMLDSYDHLWEYRKMVHARAEASKIS